MSFKNARLDYQIIYNIVESGAKVLDLGCGEGDLLFFLAKEKAAKVQGVEINEQAIYQCVKKGLSVFNSDIDSGLVGYPDKSFDYIILNQSIQEVKKIAYVLDESLRVGKKVIIGFPNFVYLPARLMFFFRGKSPVTKSLPYYWYNTPNLHFFSISDFIGLCRSKNIKIIQAHYLGQNKEINFWPNLLAQSAIFVISR